MKIAKINPAFARITNGSMETDVCKADDDVARLAIQLRNELVETHGKELFDYKDLMKLLGLSKDQVYDLMAQRDFPLKMVCGRKTITAISLARWMSV